MPQSLKLIKMINIGAYSQQLTTLQIY